MPDLRIAKKSKNIGIIFNTNYGAMRMEKGE